MTSLVMQLIALSGGVAIVSAGLTRDRKHHPEAPPESLIADVDSNGEAFIRADKSSLMRLYEVSAVDANVEESIAANQAVAAKSSMRHDTSDVDTDAEASVARPSMLRPKKKETRRAVEKRDADELTASVQSPMNIILFVMDDVGWADVGYNGGDFPTPTIDRLASAGTVLDRFYVQPQCSPTRSTIMTGRYSFRLGTQHYTTLLFGVNGGIPDDALTVGDHFRKQGYATHAIGKWHLGTGTPEQTPVGRGFDTFVGCLAGRVDFYNHTNPACDPDICLFPRAGRVESPYGHDGMAIDMWYMDNGTKRPMTPDTYPMGEYTEDTYTDRRAEIFTKHKSNAQPFFMYFAPQIIHEPLDPPPEGIGDCSTVTGGSPEVNRTRLCSMAARLDLHFSQMEEELKTNELWDNTLIFVITDNGGMTHWGDAFPASASSNWPLRGGKTTLFEGGTRAVTFLTGGALPKSARTQKVSELMFATDIFPTLARAAGLPAPKGVDGIDVWGAITNGEKVEAREIVLNVGVNPMGGIPAFVPGFRLSDGVKTGGLNFSSIIVWPYKLIIGEAYIRISAPEDEINPRSGYFEISPYKYIPETTRSAEFLLKIPRSRRKYPRSNGQTMKTYLFNIEDDEAESTNLLLDETNHEAKVDRVLAMLQRIEFYANKDEGWVPEQSNIPQQAANPMCHDWIWMYGPWSPRDDCGSDDVWSDESSIALSRLVIAAQAA